MSPKPYEVGLHFISTSKGGAICAFLAYNRLRSGHVSIWSFYLASVRILIEQLSSFFFYQLKLLGLNGNLFGLAASGPNIKLCLHFVINSACWVAFKYSMYWVPDIKGELGPTYDECQKIG